ncbi:hypothetical protein GPECTOR_42g824 [Gonium pectorale]|uniref:F-box domain-containing protein n=1 Tax=Gonium pectorale TaxID=33097 RepID=A0A150GA18_GONPE|nr:hypothetical protein GPECTOR_42g824 [Gonium pectorale]|eukprot:KXZ46613.1 hypothetical protein GPECTOR_42g824 [Gonium pectorale]
MNPHLASAAQPDAAPEPALLALPDSVLTLVAAWLPSPDKKALRLACRALRATVNGAVSSFLLTDVNLPLLAPPPPPPPQQRQQPPQLTGAGDSGIYGAAAAASSQALPHGPRRHAPLHLTFPNLTHLCLSLSPAGHHDSRRGELLASLLRTSLPALRCLRVLDLSQACRDVALGRTVYDVCDTWGLVVHGLPAGRPVRVLLHPPAALPGPPGCHDAAAGGSGETGVEAGGIGSFGRGGRGSGGTAAASGPLLAVMLALLAAHRPLAEVRLVPVPLISKRYDKPRIPSHAELVAAVSPHPPPALGAARCSQPDAPRPAVVALTGLILGPESFDPASAAGAAAAAQAPSTAAAAGAALAPWLIPNPLQLSAGRGLAPQPPLAPLPQQQQQQPGMGQGTGAAADAASAAAGAYDDPGAMRRPPQDPAHRSKAAAANGGGGGDGDGRGALEWLSMLSAAATSSGGRSLEQLTLWEAWPLAELLGGKGPAGGIGGIDGRGCGCGPPGASPVPPCLAGLRQLVLSDQQAVLDRDRLSADALAPLAALPHLTRLELASLTINTAPAAAPASATTRSGGGGAADGGDSGGSGFGPGGDAWAAAGGGGGGPLAALFPQLRHLSASVGHGSPGRPASERWGYLAGLGSSLRSLHLRAGAAEDLCLQGRSEALAALSRLTSLRLSAESGKLDGLRGLVRTLACFGPSLVSLRLARLGMRQWGTDPRVAPLELPRLTRLEFRACSGDLVAAFDGVALSAARLRRLEVRECETIRAADIQWALERQMGLTQLVLRDVPGMASAAALASLRAARPSLRISLCTADAAEVRALRRSRRAARGDAVSGPAGTPRLLGGGGSEGAAMLGASDALLRGFTADDLDELQ